MSAATDYLKQRKTLMNKMSTMMDFRMDKISWFFLAFILATMIYFILQGVTDIGGAWGYIQVFLFGLLTTLALIALMSIPVLIYCYFTKVVPDIDYSIRAGFVFTIIGIITEFIF